MFHWLKAMDVGSGKAIGGAIGKAGSRIEEDAPEAAEVLARLLSAIKRAGVKRKAFTPRDNMLDIMGYASLFGADRQAATRVTL
jgi:hypothetical protein